MLYLDTCDDEDRGSSPTVREGSGIATQALPEGRATAPVGMSPPHRGPLRFADCGSDVA